MSKLSRFKRGTVLKLPPMIKKVECLNDSNEDFKDQRPIVKKPFISQVSVDKPGSLEGGHRTRNTLESVYFNTDGGISITKSFDGESQEEKVEETKPKSKIGVSKKKAVNPILISDTPTETIDDDGEIADSSSKVVCPFCWKKLSDKLTGTTHVKSCGKNLPTERIFEALQLHEKQVKEWEGLGIAYPGFATSTNNNAKGSKPKSSKPRSRAKKIKDPEMELAMALSVSLHEEIETRKLKQKEFLVENGLEKELDLIDPLCSSKNVNSNKDGNKESEQPVSYRMKPEKKPNTKVPNTESQGVKRRGKKGDINLKETRLFTITETERQNIINERVGLILEERLNANLSEEDFYIRDKLELSSEVPKKLKPFLKEGSPLWKIAELDEKTTESKKFVIQDVVDSKARNEIETANKAVLIPAPDRSKAISNKSHQKENPNSSLKIINEPIIAKNNVKVPFIPPVTPLPKCTPSSTTSNSTLDTLHESINSTVISTDLTSKRNEHDIPYPQVVADLLRMLEKRTFTDIILYGREEKPVKCHKLILTARCPKILEDVAQCRSSTSGKVRELISLVEYSHVVVKAFVKFVYTGRIRSCLNSEELIDLEELAKKYGMVLLQDVPPSPPAKRIKTTSAYTQTEVETNIIENKEVDDSSDDIFDDSDENFNTGIADLRLPPNNETKKDFEIINSETIKNFDKSHNSVIEISSKDTSTSKQVRVNNISNCVRKSSNDYIDIFEPNAQALPHQDGNVSEDLFGDDEEDDDFLNKIANDLEEKQFTKNGCNSKKRTRSISQFSESSNCSFTATQAVEYWKKQLEKIKPVEINSTLKEPSDVDIDLEKEACPPSQKAKKYKFDSKIEYKYDSDNDKNPLEENVVDSDIEVIVIDDNSENNNIDRDYEHDHEPGKQNSPSKDVDVEIVNDNDDDFNLLANDMSLSWEDTYIAAKNKFDELQQENINKNGLESPVSRSLSSTPKKQSPRKSNTSLRLSIENVRNFEANVSSPSYSPVVSFLQSAKSNKSRMSILDRDINNQTFSAFGDQDDSMFAKIPEEVFNVPDEDLYTIPEQSSCIPSPVSSKPKRKAKGKSQHPLQQNEKEPKKKTTAKSKPSAKIKLPKTLHRTYSYSQEPQSKCQSPPTTSAMKSPNGRSPMLNYSTIDTPILKSELKKYGLKPLPRTKAKVILRHIYKETHKDDL